MKRQQRDKGGSNLLTHLRTDKKPKKLQLYKNKSKQKEGKKIKRETN